MPLYKTWIRVHIPWEFEAPNQMAAFEISENPDEIWPVVHHEICHSDVGRAEITTDDSVEEVKSWKSKATLTLTELSR